MGPKISISRSCTWPYRVVHTSRWSLRCRRRPRQVSGASAGDACGRTKPSSLALSSLRVFEPMSGDRESESRRTTRERGPRLCPAQPQCNLPRFLLLPPLSCSHPTRAPSTFLHTRVWHQAHFTVSTAHTPIIVWFTTRCPLSAVGRARLTAHTDLTSCASRSLMRGCSNSASFISLDS